jgi:hypothetical protein
MTKASLRFAGGTSAMLKTRRSRERTNAILNGSSVGPLQLSRISGRLAKVPCATQQFK